MDKRQKNKEHSLPLGIIYPHSAGIDVGSMNMVVSYQDSNGKNHVKEYGSYTEDLHAMAKELESAGVTNIAMEATGVYWMAVYEVLEEYDREVILVNPSHYKNAAGQKTDVSDSQCLPVRFRRGYISYMLTDSSGLLTLQMRATGNSGRISMKEEFFKNRRVIP